MTDKFVKVGAYLSLLLMALISGCGGGSSATSTVSGSFPLQSAYQAVILNGTSDSFDVSGACTGNSVILTSKPTPASFEGNTGFSTTTTETIDVSNCTPRSSGYSVTDFYDTNYVPFGHTDSNGLLGKFLIPPSNLPASVKVGDSATIGTETVYNTLFHNSDGSPVVSAQNVYSYVIEPDTGSTAIVNLITKTYNTGSALIYTGQTRYRISSNGQLTVLSIDIQYSVISTAHFVYKVKGTGA